MTAQESRDRLVSVDEACRICGLGRSALYERLKANELTVVKLGRRTLFSEQECFAFVQARLDEARQLQAATA
jgi:excisionase family DNA binding protein